MHYLEKIDHGCPRQDYFYIFPLKFMLQLPSCHLFTETYLLVCSSLACQCSRREREHCMQSTERGTIQHLSRNMCARIQDDEWLPESQSSKCFPNGRADYYLWGKRRKKKKKRAGSLKRRSKRKTGRPWTPCIQSSERVSVSPMRVVGWLHKLTCVTQHRLLNTHRVLERENSRHVLQGRNVFICAAIRKRVYVLDVRNQFGRQSITEKDGIHMFAKGLARPINIGSAPNKLAN